MLPNAILWERTDQVRWQLGCLATFCCYTEWIRSGSMGPGCRSCSASAPQVGHTYQTSRGFVQYFVLRKEDSTRTISGPGNDSTKTIRLRPRRYAKSMHGIGRRPAQLNNLGRSRPLPTTGARGSTQSRVPLYFSSIFSILIASCYFRQSLCSLLSFDRAARLNTKSIPRQSTKPRKHIASSFHLPRGSSEVGIGVLSEEHRHCNNRNWHIKIHDHSGGTAEFTT